jgi:hypothetical protein
MSDKLPLFDKKKLKEIADKMPVPVAIPVVKIVIGVICLVIFMVIKLLVR